MKAGGPGHLCLECVAVAILERTGAWWGLHGWEPPLAYQLRHLELLHPAPTAWVQLQETRLVPA